MIENQYNPEECTLTIIYNPYSGPCVPDYGLFELIGESLRNQQSLPHAEIEVGTGLLFDLIRVIWIIQVLEVKRFSRLRAYMKLKDGSFDLLSTTPLGEAPNRLPYQHDVIDNSLSTALEGFASESKTIQELHSRYFPE